jgi:hypothetical protein
MGPSEALPSSLVDLLVAYDEALALGNEKSDGSD